MGSLPLQLLVTGTMVGAIYGLIATGFVVIYKSAGVFNLAQGQMVMLGGYVTLACLTQLNLPLLPALIVGSVAFVIIGVLIERLMMRPLLGQSVLASVMMTIALQLVIGSIVMIVWGAKVTPFPKVFPQQPLFVGPLVISQVGLWGFVISLLVFAVFTLFFKYSKLGMLMRATAESHELAMSIGVDVKKVMRLSWMMGGVAALLGGWIMASTGSVGPQLAIVGLTALPVAIFAGLESILGCLIGGIIVGIAQNFAVGYLDRYTGGGLSDVTPYILMMLVLLVRPHGLFGMKKVERV